MSSFTNHTSIAPTEEIGKRINTESFRYYVWEDWSDEYIDVPAWYIFDWASIPNILMWILWFFLWMFYSVWYFLLLIVAIWIQKVETDTIPNSCLHDYMYTHYRKYGRIKTDLIFFQSLLVYNIPKLLKQKRYIKAFVMTMKYILMTMWLLLFSWFVWYKLEKRFIALFTKN